MLVERVKAEKDGPYDANKYFYILKLAMDTKITKLMEHILYIIQVKFHLFTFVRN